MPTSTIGLINCWQIRLLMELTVNQFKEKQEQPKENLHDELNQLKNLVEGNLQNTLGLHKKPILVDLKILEPIYAMFVNIGISPMMFMLSLFRNQDIFMLLFKHIRVI